VEPLQLWLKSDKNNGQFTGKLCEPFGRIANINREVIAEREMFPVVKKHGKI
jgi:hypothetical protein